MSFEITLAVLLAALLHASWNAMIKGGSDVLLDTASIVTGAGLLGLPFLLIVPVPNAASWPYILASIATHLAYYFLMVNAYRTGELSLVYPLMRGAVGLALANAAVIAVYTIIDGTGARLAGDPWSYIVWLFVLDSIPFSIYMLATRRRMYFTALAQRRWHGLIGGGLSAAAYAISVWAMTKAPVALVASLRETSVLFATLIGARLLKERLTPRRWAGVGAVVIGVVALKAA